MGLEYEVTIEVDGKTLNARGRSKKIAKANVAIIALKEKKDDGTLERRRVLRENKKNSREHGGKRGKVNNQRSFNAQR